MQQGDKFLEMGGSVEILVGHHVEEQVHPAPAIVFELK
jgi:hypothetical protein